MHNIVLEYQKLRDQAGRFHLGLLVIIFASVIPLTKLVYQFMPKLVWVPIFFILIIGWLVTLFWKQKLAAISLIEEANKRHYKLTSRKHQDYFDSIDYQIQQIKKEGKAGWIPQKINIADNELPNFLFKFLSFAIMASLTAILIIALIDIIVK